MKSHIYFMQEAMALAEEARFHAPPNPWVGCVIVKDDQIIGKGFTQAPGQAHAEIMALREAKGASRNSKLYTTLEPCAHTGKTPPCTQAIIDAGISEVYFGIEDPDSRVRGKGSRLLQENGIKVFNGICENEIQKTLTPYLYHRQKNLPYTILKAAISLDGRIAASDHSSQWITCTTAREDSHLLRASSQAILVGTGTALKDNPQLTIRHPSLKFSNQPLRVLLDAKGKVQANGALFNMHLAPTLVITTPECPEVRQREWLETGAEVAIVSATTNGVNLQEVWEILGKRSILQVLVEGGATLHTALLETTLVNRLIIYVGPLLLGSSAFPFYQKKLSSLQEGMKLSLLEIKKIDNSIRLEYEFIK